MREREREREREERESISSTTVGQTLSVVEDIRNKTFQ